MFATLPKDPESVLGWRWDRYQPFYKDLRTREITGDNIHQWLSEWTRLSSLLDETYARLYLKTAQNTEDTKATEHFHAFLDDAYPQSKTANHQLIEKLLASGIEPDGFEIPLRNLHADADLFRQKNVPLLSQETKLSMEYDKIAGRQTIFWEGKEKTIAQLRPIYQDPDRSTREKVWRLSAERQLDDRESFNALWVQFMDLRGLIAKNADRTDYRSYMWQHLLRFDYTPEDCETFQKAIEEVIVPAAERIYERRRQRLGLETLRPWDLDVDPLDRPALRPFGKVDDLITKTSSIFNQVDSNLAEYFQTMQDEDLLDLENRKNKAPGAFCISLMTSQRPYIFQNAVGLHDDVQTIIHESGHAFHVFETIHLPYYEQQIVGMEFAEIASMAMELLAAPYLTESEGGFYTDKDAARARIEHLEVSILFWPYMAVVDAFQHWVYENHEDATDPDNCDAKWTELWHRFMGGVDWSGFDNELATGWHRKLHIHQVPFYYVEYGLAQLGAVQIWANAIENQTEAVKDYRKALALGGTVPLPQLYKTAGAKFAFDAETLRKAVGLMEKTIEELEAVA